MRFAAANMAGLLVAQVDTQCILPNVDSLQAAVATNVENPVSDCNIEVKRVHGDVEGWAQLLQPVSSIYTTAETLNDTSVRVQKLIEDSKPMAKVVPKLNTVLSGIDSFCKAIAKRATDVMAKLQRLKRVHGYFKTVEDGLATASEHLDTAEEHIATVMTRVQGVETCSKNNGCAFKAEIERSAGQVNRAPFGDIGTQANRCKEVLSHVNLGFPSVTFPDIEALMELVRDMVNAIVAWIENALSQVLGEASKQMCCDNVLRLIGFVGNAVAASTCWSEPLIDSVTHELNDALLGQLVDKINAMNNVVRAVNQILNKLPSASIPYPRVSASLGGFDSNTCLVTGPTFSVSSNEIIITTPEVPLLAIPDTDGRFDITAIGSAISKSCKDAIDGLGGDCCDAANICNPHDKIVMYEGNSCTQNIVGTFPIQTGTHHHDMSPSCRSNDEARSLRLIGPLLSGTRIELFDDPHHSTTEDDYAVITLTRDLLAGEEWCVWNFHGQGSMHSSSTRTTSLFKLDYHFKDYAWWQIDKVENGLDGKVSSVKTYAPNTPTPIHNEVVLLVSRHGSRDECVDTWSTGVKSSSCHGGTNQQWALEDDGTIRSPWDTGRCLDYAGSNYGHDIWFGSCHGGINQKWDLHDDGTLRTRAMAGWCIDLNLGSSNLYLHPCHGGNNQQWDIIKAPAEVVTKHDESLCMDIPSNNNAYMHSCHGESNQLFFHLPNGQIRMKGASDKCLDYAGSDHEHNIYMSTCHGGSNQKWDLTAGAKLQTRAQSGWCVDMNLDNKNLYVHACHEGANQRFEASSLAKYAYFAGRCGKTQHLASHTVASEAECTALCESTARCQAFNIAPSGSCHLKAGAASSAGDCRLLIKSA